MIKDGNGISRDIENVITRREKKKMRNDERRVKKQKKYDILKTGYNKKVEQEQQLTAFYNSLLCKA